MSSAIQLYSFPAQLGRRGTTAVVVVGLHVVMALGIIAGMTLRPVPAPPTWIPTTFLPKLDAVPPRPRTPPEVNTAGPNNLVLDDAPEPIAVQAEPDPLPPGAGQTTDGEPIDTRPPVTVSAVHLLRHEDPKYTAAEIRAGEHGSVAVRVLVGVDGRAMQVEVATTSGYARLDATALESVRHWLFAPAQTASGPIASWVTLKVTFRLLD